MAQWWWWWWWSIYCSSSRWRLWATEMGRGPPPACRPSWRGLAFRLLVVLLWWKPDEDLVKDLVSPGLQVRSPATGRWVIGWVGQAGQGLYTRNMQTQHCFHPSYKLRKQRHVLQGQDKTGCLSIIQVVHLSMWMSSLIIILRLEFKRI